MTTQTYQKATINKGDKPLPNTALTADRQAGRQEVLVVIGESLVPVVLFESVSGCELATEGRKSSHPLLRSAVRAPRCECQSADEMNWVILCPLTYIRSLLLHSPCHSSSCYCFSFHPSISLAVFQAASVQSLVESHGCYFSAGRAFTGGGN